MRNLSIVILLVALLFSCGSPNVSVLDLKVGDSLFVDKYMRVTAATRVHETNSSGFVDGHAQVDSSKIVTVSYTLDRKYFFEKENTYIGTFQSYVKNSTSYIARKKN